MTKNEQRRPARNAAATTSPATVAAAAVGLRELDAWLDARERIVAAIDHLEAGEQGIDPCRAVLEALLGDLDHEVAA